MEDALFDSALDVTLGVASAVEPGAIRPLHVPSPTPEATADRQRAQADERINATDFFTHLTK